MVTGGVGSTNSKVGVCTWHLAYELTFHFISTPHLALVIAVEHRPSFAEKPDNYFSPVSQWAFIFHSHENSLPPSIGHWLSTVDLFSEFRVVR